jgi:hypothetical protein
MRAAGIHLWFVTISQEPQSQRYMPRSWMTLTCLQAGQ